MSEVIINNVCFNENMLALRNEINTDIFDYFGGMKTIPWINNIKSIFNNMQNDVMMDEKDFLIEFLENEGVEQWLSYPCEQIYFHSPNFNYDAAKHILYKYIRGRAVQKISSSNYKLEKKSPGRLIKLGCISGIQIDNTQFMPRDTEFLMSVINSFSKEKMRKCVWDVFVCGLTVHDACKKNHYSTVSYTNDMKWLREQKSSNIKKMMKSKGFYMDDDLNSYDKNWNNEYLEKQYNMPKNKGINKGYYEQFKMQ